MFQAPGSHCLAFAYHFSVYEVPLHIYSHLFSKNSPIVWILIIIKSLSDKLKNIPPNLPQGNNTLCHLTFQEVFPILLAF